MKKTLCHIGIISAILFFLSIGILCAALGTSQVSLLAGIDRNNRHTAILGDKTTTLNIFNTATKEGKSVFAPGSTGNGGFTLFNISGYPVHYKMTFSQENPMNIPVEYKIRNQDGELIAGMEDTWVDITSLQELEGELRLGEQAKYDLEWRWNDTLGDIDTSINEKTSDSADYSLAIHIDSYPVGIVNIFAPLKAHTDLLSIILALVLTTGIGVGTYWIVKEKPCTKKGNKK